MTVSTETHHNTTHPCKKILHIAKHATNSLLYRNGSNFHRLSSNFHKKPNKLFLKSRCNIRLKRSK